MQISVVTTMSYYWRFGKSFTRFLMYCSGDSGVIQGFQFGHQTLNISACFGFFPSDIF